MSVRRVFIAHTSFTSDKTRELTNHPHVHNGVVRQGTRLYEDDPIVIANDTEFVLADDYPSQTPAPELRPHEATDGPSGPEWIGIVKAYRATGKPRPKQEDVADKMGFATEEPLRKRLRSLGITRWHDVHALVIAMGRDSGT